jgi:hypothetical protein
VFQQDAEVWEVVELTMKDVVSDLLLEHPPHPLDICAALPFAVGSGLRFSGTCGLAHERSKPGRRKNWRVNALGEVDAAISNYRDMLRLNPSDNQGIR